MNIGAIDATPLADVAALLRSLAEHLQSGFEDALDAWGRDDLLPGWATSWPQPSWAPLAAATLRSKVAKGYPETPLIRTGALIMAATIPHAAGNMFDVSRPAGTLGRLDVGVYGDVIEYAAKQHDEIPEGEGRPWDPIDDADLDMLAVRIERSIREWD